MRKIYYTFAIFIFFSLLGIWIFSKFNFNQSRQVGQAIDSLNGVIVYYNSSVDNVSGRNISDDGYNIGLKYQCVEFVKRYYFQHFNHKMPNSFGHAKDFYDKHVADNQINPQRDLIQFSNPSSKPPKVDDLIVFSGNFQNKYGHVAIISKVEDKKIEIIQQNPGPFESSRANFDLEFINGKWKIKNNSVLAWLRMKNK